MTVRAATLEELRRLGEAAEGSVEGQTALALAAALDDRAGVQAGGLASTAKELRALMIEIRDRYKPVERSALKLLQGDGLA
jgi:hypothetical protein